MRRRVALSLVALAWVSAVVACASDVPPTEAEQNLLLVGLPCPYRDEARPCGDDPRAVTACVDMWPPGLLVWAPCTVPECPIGEHASCPDPSTHGSKVCTASIDGIRWSPCQSNWSLRPTRELRRLGCIGHGARHLR